MSTILAEEIKVPLGQILRIPCKHVKGKSDAQPIAVQAIAEQLKTSGKNVLPVMVRLLAEDKYQAILNAQILDAAKQAKLDFVWCVVIDEAMQAQLQVETGQCLKINIATASEEDLTTAFEYIKATKPGFKTVTPHVVAKAIADYRKANKLKNLNFLTKLKCGIGKAKIASLVENLVV